MLEMDAYDEPDPDSDLDYEETYSKRRRGKRGVGRVSIISEADSGWMSSLGYKWNIKIFEFSIIKGNIFITKGKLWHVFTVRDDLKLN